MRSELTFGPLNAWPLPIARALRKAEIADSVAGQYLHLLHACEALLQFVGSVALLDAAAEGDQIRFLSDDRPLNASTGVWRECLNALLAKRKTPTIAGLRALRTNKARWAQASSTIRALVDARNAQSHPIRVPSEAEAEARLPGLTEALKQALDHFSCLEKVILLRMHGDDPVTGRVRVSPLMGPESLSTPRSLRWVSPPAKDKIVAVDLDSDRYVVLEPLYRWHDHKLQAYLRTADGKAQWYLVDAPDQAPRVVPVAEPTWLTRRLKDSVGIKRGTLPDARMVLGVRRATATPDAPDVSVTSPTSAPPPSTARRVGLAAAAAGLALGIAHQRKRRQGEAGEAEESAAPPVLAPPSPPRRRSDSTLAVQTVLAIVGFILVGVLVWMVTKGFGDHDAQAAASSTNAPGDLIPATEPPTTVFKSLAAAYAAGDADAYHRHYLDNLECYYELTRHPTAKRVAGTRRGMRDRPKHYRQLDVIERSRKGPMAFIEERFQIAPLYKKAPPIMSRWYKLVQVEGFWRIAAEAGSHPNGEPCKCNYRLREEFGLPPPLKAAQTKPD